MAATDPPTAAIRKIFYNTLKSQNKLKKITFLNIFFIKKEILSFSFIKIMI